MKNPTEKPIAAYIRLSTREQAKPDTIQSHLFQIRKAIAAIGGEVNEDLIFVEIMSGRRNDRPKFLHLVKLIEKGEVGTIVVRLDRLSRDSEMFLTLSKLFERTGVRLYEIIRQRFINFSDPDDWAEYQRSGISAERESRVTSRRIKDQKEFARFHNKVLGHCPFGYQRSKEGGYEPHPENWPKAQRMIEIFFEENHSTARLMRRMRSELGVEMTIPGVTHWLQSPVPRGNTPYGTRDSRGYKQKPSDIRYNTHQALISREAANRIDRVFERNTRTKGSRSLSLYPLSGLMKCANCGSNFGILNSFCSKMQKRYLYVYCAKDREGIGCLQPIEGKKKPGRNRSIPYALVDEAVKRALQARGEAIIAAGIQAAAEEVESPEVALLKQQIAEYQAKAEIDPDLVPIVERKRRRLAELLADDQLSFDSLRHTQRELARYAKSPDFWNQATKEDLTVIYLESVEVILCDASTKSVSIRLRA